MAILRTTVKIAPKGRLYFTNKQTVKQEKQNSNTLFTVLNKVKNFLTLIPIYLKITFTTSNTLLYHFINYYHLQLNVLHHKCASLYVFSITSLLKNLTPSFLLAMLTPLKKSSITAFIPYLKYVSTCLSLL